jgi:D-hydantoinase
MEVDVTIKNGQIVKPDQTINAGIAIKDGKIVMIADESMLPEAKRVIDAEGRYVLPGLIDPHMHVDWPDWEYVEATRSSTKAAAAGGYTTVINFLSGPESLIKNFQTSRKIFEENSFTDFAFHMGIFTDTHVQEIPEIAEFGVPSFKFFLPYRGSEVVEPLTGIDDGIVYMGLAQISKLGYPARALIHCENVEIVFKLKDKIMKENRDNVQWDDVRPPVCEIDGIRRVITFAEDTRCPVYVVHTSTKEGVAEIKSAKERGVDIKGETCVQYLVLTAEDYDWILGKVNPPLRRDREHCEKLWEGIGDGSMDTIGSDHAPCARKHKKDFWTATVGMAGIQTLLPVLLTEGVNKNRISINKVVEICSFNVAKTFGLLPRKGCVEVGADADLVILDLEKRFVVRADELYHISDFSPYEGKELTGRPILTMLRGNIVFEHSEIATEPGSAVYVPRYAQPK